MKLFSIRTQIGQHLKLFHIIFSKNTKNYTLFSRFFLNLGSFDLFHFDKQGERYGKSSLRALGKIPNKKNFEVSS